MNTSRTSLKDCINIGKAVENISEYVIISKSNSDDDMFAMANVGRFLVHQGDDYYRAKRTVANNLKLYIISDWPVVMK